MLGQRPLVVVAWYLRYDVIKFLFSAHTYSMKQSLQLRLGQQLTMTPQLQQAIRLLQLSTLELQVEIQTALESNPMLEELTDDAQETSATLPEERADPPAESSLFSESAEFSRESSADEGRDDHREDRSESELDLRGESLPDDLPVDSQWEDCYDMAVARSGSSAESEDDDKEYDRYNSRGESLRDHLVRQIQLMPFSATDAIIALAIVDAINDDGYLSYGLDDVQATVSDLCVDLDEIEAVLHQVQNCTPTGVAARDLRECLLLQLRALPTETPWRTLAHHLVDGYLALLARHDFTQLVRRMKTSEEDLREAVRLIQRLDPRPGSQISAAEVQYIVPDVLVTRVRSVWKVELNLQMAPRLRVNPHYASLVRRADNSPDNHYLRSNLQEARWFLKSLQSRNETLLKVAGAIVERQRAFLEQGDEAMRPLVLHDISESLGMHESTISRVTTQKYMHTPRGIYELKYFFSNYLNASNGEECSSTAIRAFVRRLVAGEEPGKPLSDSKIAELLGARGIQVARRTVAKYREAMAIPPSSERKRFS